MFGVILIQNGLHNQLTPPPHQKSTKVALPVSFAEINLKFDVSVNQNIHSERDS